MFKQKKWVESPEFLTASKFGYSTKCVHKFLLSAPSTGNFSITTKEILQLSFVYNYLIKSMHQNTYTRDAF